MDSFDAGDWLERQIRWFNRTCLLICDGRCDKAWGVNHRPRIYFDPEEPDDCAWLADGELGEAPVDPGTYEGGQAKPTRPEERLNQWCARECERSEILEVEEWPDLHEHLPDFSVRRYNQPWKHLTVSGEGVAP